MQNVVIAYLTVSCRYALVWQAASEVYDEIIATEGWANRQDVYLSAEDLGKTTIKVNSHLYLSMVDL